MIIKLLDVKGTQQHWKFIDNIEQVDFRVISKDEQQNPEFHPTYYISDNLDKKTEVYRFIILTTTTGAMLSICTNLAVYLLNNEGKTIERI